MFSFFKKNKKDIKQIAKKELSRKFSVIKSLRDYDTGEKDISTGNIERRLPDIRVAPR
jgi:hypothetical protein